MRLLIVDDARTDLDACRTSAKKWNKSHSSERQIVLIEKKTFQEAQEYFTCHESCNVDGVILHLLHCLTNQPTITLLGGDVVDFSTLAIHVVDDGVHIQ